VWLFLASEVMLFGGLFSAYFMLRAGAIEPWAPVSGHTAGAVLSTVLLFGGTAAFAFAGRMASNSQVSRYRMWMTAAIVLPLLFLPVKALQYHELAQSGILPSTNTQWATYFLLTGVHALHVAGGVAVNVWLLCTSGARAIAEPAAVMNRLKAAGLYWYFVDAVWLVLVVLLYVA
jgi:cytochrome c oxidase subunit 3